MVPVPCFGCWVRGEKKMKEDKIPKVFISYSWSNDDITMALAERLMSHGVEVILDKWDLKEGQDKYAFMEQCVNNPEVDRVLIVCDQKYADKANNREGGVGDETVIISTEIYGKVNQEKFIPIITECDVFKIHIWELFVCVVAFLRHYDDYKSLNSILSNTYFLIESGFGSNAKPTNYAHFEYYSRYIEEDYKEKTENKNKFTLMGNAFCCEREKYPIYTKEMLAQADLFLYQVFNAFDLVNENTLYRDKYWFPTCYVYTKERINEWEKMKSRKYCEKMYILFGVDNIVSLKSIISNCTYDSEMRYRGSFDAAPAILSCIKIEDIGSMN